jgi:hypothetical protein
VKESLKIEVPFLAVILTFFGNSRAPRLSFCNQEHPQNGGRLHVLFIHTGSDKEYYCSTANRVRWKKGTGGNWRSVRGGMNGEKREGGKE